MWTGSRSLRFSAAGAPQAARCIRIFADESACLLADNVRDEVVNNSQLTGRVEIAVLCARRYFSQLIVSLGTRDSVVG
jgi:hypothetical protein